MELENRKKIVLGIFILLGLIILVGVIYYIGTSRQLFGSRVEVSAVFHNVEGLKEGNNVWFGGIKVGVVKAVELATDSTVRADLLVNEDARPFIKKDSYASIESKGMMGEKIIRISAGSADASSVEDGDVIPSKEPLSIENIVKTVKETADQASTLATNLSDISEKIKMGEGVIGKLIYDTAMSQRLKVSINMLEQSGRNARQFTRQINEVAYRLNNGDGLAGRMVNDEEWANKVEATLDSLHRTSSRLTAAGRDLQIFTEKLNEEKGTIQQLLTDSVMARDMHQALINIKEGTENMDEVMSTINRSWLLNLFSK